MATDLPLIIIGDGAFAEIAYEYFTHDSPYSVVAFAVERTHRTKTILCGVPVVDVEGLEREYAPAAHGVFAAVGYSEANTLRERLYAQAKAGGYRPASYVSSRAFVWPNAAIGEHCFIFEHNTVQPFAAIGDNVVLWSGNHIGHHSAIGSHTFVSSHCVLSGFVSIGTHAFIGVNASVAEHVAIGNRTVVGAGAVVLGDVPDDTRVVGLWRRQKPVSG